MSYVKIASKKSGLYLDGPAFGEGPRRYRRASRALDAVADVLERDPGVVLVGENYTLGPDKKVGEGYCVMSRLGSVVGRDADPIALLEKHAAEMVEERKVPNLKKISAVLDKMASLFEFDWEGLGVNKTAAHKFAKRCDKMADEIDLIAKEEFEELMKPDHDEVQKSEKGKKASRNSFYQ